jgi:predicted permease
MHFPWNRVEIELKRELEHHIHELTAEFERRGHSREEAARLARREFGGAEQVKEECRDERRWAWMTGIRQDVVFAFRQMRRSPGFAATAVLTLTLGIAANVIVFGVLREIVLRPVDLPRPDRVMHLGLLKHPYPMLAFPEVRDVRDGSTVFSGVGAYTPQNFGFEANGFLKPVWGYEVTGQYFEAAGIKPLLGRLLGPADDDHPGASEAAVLSWPTWKNDFGGDLQIVGQTVRINKHPYTIVGVTPEGFYGVEKLLQPAVFVPFANGVFLEGVNWLEQRRWRNLFTIVRLKDGATWSQAKAELATIAARMREQNPVEEQKADFKLSQPGMMGDFFGAPVRAFLVGVLVLAGIVLLGACANLGSLFAARTADRAREIAIRLAIGSSRWRIFRQVLVEALSISILGGACACALAWVALNGMVNMAPADYPVRLAVVPQPSLILIGLLASVLAGVVFGAMPLHQIFKTDPNLAMKSGGAGFAGRRWALRDMLLAAQIALCCVTVTGAFVSVRGLGKTLNMELGFRPDAAAVTRVELSQGGYTGEAAARFQRRLLERISELPGVEAVAYAHKTPLDFPSSTAIFAQETTDLRPVNRAFNTSFFRVSAGYFAAAGTRLMAGRDINFADTAKTPRVAVVNREFARRLFRASDAVGRYFKNREGELVQIVGIAADGKYQTLSEDPQAAVFYAISQEPDTGTSIVVRSRIDPTQMAAAVRKTIGDLDASLPILRSGAWSSQLSLSFFPSRAATVSLGLFGAFGLLLSIAGTFGLATYTVSKRVHELSIRVALGGQARQIVSAALGRMLILLASGSAAGIVLGAAVSRLLSAVVYQASAQDPLVLAAVAFTMGFTGLVSIAGPVRRALHIDPARILREQ